jgi:hypothetical protein
LWAAVERVSAFACFDLYELADNLKALGNREALKGLSLRFQAETRTPLASRGHPAIGDDRACHDTLWRPVLVDFVLVDFPYVLVRLRCDTCKCAGLRGSR